MPGNQVSKGSDDPSPLQPYEAPLPKIAIRDVAARVCSLTRGERLTLIGIGRDEAGNAIRTTPAGIRGALLVESGDSRDAQVILGRLLDDLAEIALERWPRWYGSDEETAHTILEHAAADRFVSAPWVRAAARRAVAGHRPRFRKVAKDIEFVQLMRAIDPLAPVLIAAVDPVASARAMSVIQALEWCAAHGASVVTAFAARPPLTAPWDRVLYGALEVTRDA